MDKDKRPLDTEESFSSDHNFYFYELDRLKKVTKNNHNLTFYIVEYYEEGFHKTESISNRYKVYDMIFSGVVDRVTLVHKGKHSEMVIAG